MGRKTGAYLEPSSYIGEYSIGADLAKNASDPDYLAAGITTLRNGTHELLKSDDHEDLTSVTRINNYFARNDYQLASRDLGLSLDTPLQKQIVEWLAHANDHDTELFCRWSLERTLDLTRALRYDRRLLDVHTMEKTEKLVDIGMFPRLAIEVTDKAIQRYQLQGMDAFHSGGPNRIGFCTDHVIGLANLYTDRSGLRTPSGEMKRTMFHENVHAAGRDRGFFWGISTQVPVLRIMEEAFVEHATDVAHTRLFKQPDVINPAKRWHLLDTTIGTYVAERTFLSVVCDQARIPVEHLSEAYYRPRGDKRGEQLREGIERKIGKYFGGSEHFFTFVSDYENARGSKRKQLVHDTIDQLSQSA